MEPQPIPSAFIVELLGSLERLREAGIVEDYSFGPGPDAGWVTLTPAAARLLNAGRQLALDEGFLEAMASADMATVRSWVDREAKRMR